MPITVLEAAPDHNLTTLDTLKGSLGITNDSNDDVLEQLIREASSYASTYTNRIFGRERVTEDFVGNGTPQLVLSRTPIVAIEQVKFDTTVQDLTEITIVDADAGIVQRKGNWTSTKLPFNTIDLAPSSYGEYKWHITYTGGWVLPNWEDSDVRDLPYDLERAVLETVRTLNIDNQLGQAGIDSTVSKYKIGDTEVTWGNRGGSSSSESNAYTMGMPDKAISILNFYRRIK